MQEAAGSVPAHTTLASLAKLANAAGSNPVVERPVGSTPTRSTRLKNMVIESTVGLSSQVVTLVFYSELVGSIPTIHPNSVQLSQSVG